MKAILSLGCLILGLLTAPAYADGPDGVLGMWVADDGKARIEITKQDDVYGGRIVWLKEPLYPADDEQGMGGKPKVDRHNPDKSLQGQPIIGLKLVQGFKYAGDNVWSGGTIYDPESGKTYSCKMTLMMDGSLRVRGYYGISLFGETRIWSRPPPDAASAQPQAHP